MTSSINTSKKNQTTCHWLPCNIDYDGMAPVHIYFQHEPINSDGTIQAAAFRGRGLLSKSSHQDDVNGVVLQQGTTVAAAFQKLQEWEHESSPQLLQFQTSTFQRAKEWMELNQAVHGELPVLE